MAAATLSPPPYSLPKVSSPRVSPPEHPLLSLSQSPGSDTYAAILKSCSSLQLGKQIHAHAHKNAYAGSPEFLQTKLLVTYSTFGDYEIARDLFDKMPNRTLHSWSTIFTSCVDHGLFKEAIFLFLEFLEEDLDVEFFVFPGIFRAVGGMNDLKLGKQLHGFVLKFGFLDSIHVSNSLVYMYGKCLSLGDAESVFITMAERDLVTWNSIITALIISEMVFEALEVLERMRILGDPAPNLISWSAVISGFSQKGYNNEAINLFKEMICQIEPNARVIASVLPCCGKLGCLKIGREIHGHAIRHDFFDNPYVVNGLIDVYRRCGDMNSASMIFWRFSPRNSASFNTMLTGFCEMGEVEKARKLFSEMKFFGADKDSISWNAMISGYVSNNNLFEALEIFKEMQLEYFEVDSFTLSSILTACDLRQGKEIHSCAIARSLNSDPHVVGALIEMYCRNGDLNSARTIFDLERLKDRAIWNSMISGYARLNQMNQARILLAEMKNTGLEISSHTWNGILSGLGERENYEGVLELFNEMRERDVNPDVYTMGIVLLACSKLGRIEKGKQIHGRLIRSCWDSDTHLGSSLVDMYAKCGKIDHGEKAFKRIRQHNLVAYNSMIAGFAAHGLSKKVNEVFDQMRSNGWDPDEITFLSLLSLCAHEGDVDRCWQYFSLMEELKVKADVRHYSCMVDLLSRAGHMDQAFRLAQEMPFEPDAVTWGAILRGCVLHGFTEIGELAAKELMKLEGNSGTYLALAKLYGYAKKGENFGEMMGAMREKGMKKSSGCSWIEDGTSRVHVFLAGDTLHEEMEEIYETLKRLNSHMRFDSF